MTQASRRKYIVLLVAGVPKVYAKQDLKRMIAQHKFRKGVTIQDLERKAILITA